MKTETAYILHTGGEVTYNSKQRIGGGGGVSGNGRGGASSNEACDLSGEERPTPWEHGPFIAEKLKKVEMEGLSGNIRYI